MSLIKAQGYNDEGGSSNLQSRISGHGRHVVDSRATIRCD